jgi:competence protein ComEC
MKFPALALAASLASGIAAGRLTAAFFPQSVALFLALPAFLLLCGLAAAAFRRTMPAFIAALVAWCALGALAARLEQISVPSDHITSLLSRDVLSIDQPLRWRGTLRADPLDLPWGQRYQIELESVQSTGIWMATSGGLRADYYFDERSADRPTVLRAGDHVELLVRARRVRNFANPGSFDYRAFLARQGIHLTSTLRSPQLIEQIPGSPPSLTHYFARLRGRLLRQTDALFAEDDGRAAVLRAMLLGDRSFLDTEQVEAFRQTGAYHILVLSGLQVGVLAAMLMWIGRRMRWPPLFRITITIAALWAYAAIVEDQPPIARAVWMATFYLLAYALFRRTHVLNAVGLAALVILVARPSEISDASFLLSFLAVATIGGIAAPWLERTAGVYLRALDHIGDVTRDASHLPRAAQFRLDLRAATAWLTRRLPQFPSPLVAASLTAPCRAGLWLWETIVISAAIQLTMLPLMAQYFHRVTVLGLAANVPAVLLTGLVVPFGFLSLGAGILWQPLGQLLGYLLAPVLGGLLWSVQAVSDLHWSSYRVPSPPVAVLAAFFVVTALWAGTLLMAKRFAARATGAIVVSLALLIAAYPFVPRLDRQHLEVTILDVGQGDSIFLAFPDGRTMLVDGGGLPGSAYIRSRRTGMDVGEDVVSPYLWSRRLKRIDVVALTHAHQDHLGGLAAVLRNFLVGELWVGRQALGNSAYARLLADAATAGVPVVHHLRGDSFDWGGVRMRVLWPTSAQPDNTDENDDSLVLRLETASASLLLTGDIEKGVETALATHGDDLDADFLKVPHHGSNTSSTEAFLDSVHPRFAAISVGENNPFGHPNPVALRRLNLRGARVYSTDRDGAITVLAGAKNLELRTFLPAP